MKQYRIKTEAEFIEEFGEDWKGIVDWVPNHQMNNIFGKSLDSNKGRIINDNGNTWSIFPNMITDKPLPKLTIVKDGEAVEVPVKQDKSSILTEAEDIVNGARATDYGSAKESFKRIAELTNLMLSPAERELLMHDGQI